MSKDKPQALNLNDLIVSHEEKQQQVIDRVLEMDLKSVADQLVADAIHQADEQYQEAERKGKAIEAARNG